ncbi:MAG: glycosyltransferase family 4 protein [Erysipelotrichaceae bacterium]
MLKNKRTHHILVVSQYYEPEQFRINDLCRQWVQRGYEVTVVTGIPNYPQGSFYPGYGLFKRRREKIDGVMIHRLPILARGRSKISLALNYLSFVISGFFFSNFTRIDADSVYIFEVSPMTQALVGVWYARRRRIPCSIYVTDLWPENVQYVLNLRNHWVLQEIGKMVDYVYKHCDQIFTSSRSFVEAIQSRGVALKKLEYWPQYAESYNKPYMRDASKTPNMPIDGKLNLVFAGNIGVAQGLDLLIDVAKELRDDGVRVRFNLVGDGRYKNTLRKNIIDNGLDDIFNFIDRQPADLIPQFLANADAALILLSKNPVFAMTLPSKLQSCLACGVPILACADGEVRQVIQEAKAGLCSEAGNASAFGKAIKEFSLMDEIDRFQMGKNALDYSEKHFSQETLLKRMDQWFQSAVKQGADD